MPILRLHGVVHLLPDMPSLCLHGQVCLYLLMPSLVWFRDITILRVEQVAELQVLLIAERHKLVEIPVFAKINSPRFVLHIVLEKTQFLR